MPIIISKEGKKAKKIEETSFEHEQYLQKYIYENPETLPLEDYKENIRLFIVAREFPTESGYIDALGVDADGDPRWPWYLLAEEHAAGCDSGSVGCAGHYQDQLPGSGAAGG